MPKLKLSRSSDHRAFTLVELLVVIAIIALLMGLLIPAVSGARESARRIQCANNLKQLGIAAQAYESSNGVFPPGVENKLSVTTEANWGWLALLLPQLEQQNVYDALQVNQTPLEDMAVNLDLNPKFRSATTQPISLFLCPTFGIPTKSDDGQSDTFKSVVVANVAFATSHYAASYGVQYLIGTGGNGAMPVGKGRPAARITDGLSDTFMAGEIPQKAIGIPDGNPHYVKWIGCTDTPGNNAHCRRSARTTWYPPNSINNIQSRRISFGSAHAGGGAQMLLCDGSVRMIDDTIDCGTEASGNRFPIMINSTTERYGVYQKLGNCSDARPISEY
jgi:prepilin-type N-terminal cleavage/methylation domain-containing protein/prepilin-type processing-associated H-X9-DG protein